jgi:hypothetical protein
VKGRKAEFMIYELLAFRASDDPELRVGGRDEQLSAMTWQASQRHGGWRYRVILEEFPRDPVAKFIQEECEKRVADFFEKVGR